MEKDDLYQLGIALEDCQEEEPEECILQREGEDQIRPKNHVGAGNVQSPSLHRPELAIQHLTEYRAKRSVSSNGNMVNAANVMVSCEGDNEDRYQHIVKKNQTPKVDYRKMYAKSIATTITRITNEKKFTVRTSQGPEAASRPSSDREAILPIEKQVNLSRIRSASSTVTRVNNEKTSTIRTSQGPKTASRASSHREVTSPNQSQASLPRTRSASASVTMVTGENKSAVRTSQGPKAASRASSQREVSLPNQKQVTLSQLRSGSASVARVDTSAQTVRTSKVESKNQCNVSNMSLISDKQSSEVQHGDNNAVKTCQIESTSSDSPIVQENRGTKANNHKGKRVPTPKHLSAEKIKEFTSPIRKSQSHSTPSSHKVLEKQVGSRPSEKPSKSRKEPSKTPSKQPSEQDLPTYHIWWDGFDDPTPQPFGQNCNICDDDLAYSPTDEESDPSILPPVSVLSCGHAFHCQCLELVTAEEQSKDLPCFMCISLF